MKILITGGGGFIGSWLAPELRAHGHKVAVTELIDGDLREPGVAERQIAWAQPHVVVHLAAQVGRAFGEDDIAHTITNNALATARVAQAATEARARMLYCSTSEVYGDQGDAWCVEGGPMLLPHNAYGLTKRHGEEIARLYAERLQIVRLSMPFGPGLPSGRGRAALVNFLWWASRGEQITVHRNSSRSWCWVGDTVRGLRAVIEDGDVCAADDAAAGTFNVGRSDNETSMAAVARMACDLVGASHDLIRLVEPPANQTPVKRLANARLRALGWWPQVDLADGLITAPRGARLPRSTAMPPWGVSALSTGRITSSFQFRASLTSSQSVSPETVSALPSSRPSSQRRLITTGRPPA